MSHMPKFQLPNGTGEAENAVHLNLEGQVIIYLQREGKTCQTITTLASHTLHAVNFFKS